MVAATIESRAPAHSRAVFLRAAGLTTLAAYAFLFAHLALGLGGAGLDGFVDRWLYDALELVAAAACLLRAAWIRPERVAWTVLGLGLLSFAVGDLCFDFLYAGAPPTPSAADAFYLGLYPGCYAALVLLIRSRIRLFDRGLWLDGVIAALTSASVASAILIQVVLDRTGGSVSAMFVDLAYPVCDVVLLALVVFVFAISGWRPGRAWATVGGAFAVITVADSLFLYLNATGGYAEGTLLDALWPAALLLLAASSWQLVDGDQKLSLRGRPLAATPLVCGAAALAVFGVSAFERLNALAVALAAAAVVTVFVRTALSFRDNSRLLDDARAQSLTDYLTGLGNRRRLMADLERAHGQDSSEPRLLVVFDLNGFKHYNDTFGHPSGDALLARLAGKLAIAAGANMGAYRLGGDEFCLFGALPSKGADRQIDAALAALTEDGDGFSVGAVFGVAVLPEEAIDASGALRLADQRLYAQKYNLYRGRGDSYEVLLRALTEREPNMREQLRGIADLSAAVGSQLGMTGHALRQLRVAAELHDVGKLAIPDDVLQKPGALSNEEWAFIRRHTEIGQRILDGAPALQEVGHIVRATHERWDGGGYGDGLAGREIPLAARVIAVCDAYTAMISDRPYRPAMTRDAAVAELLGCAGSQFDPDVVRAFLKVQGDAGPMRLLRPEALASER